MLGHRKPMSATARVLLIMVGTLLFVACDSNVPRLNTNPPRLSSLPLATQTPTRTTTPRPTLTATRTPRPRTSTPTLTPSPTIEPWITPMRRYYFPVQPPKIASYVNAHHDYPAADIFVPIGSTVVAVTDGVIDEVSRVDRWEAATDDGSVRGGLWITIVGDDNVRYHTSHLSSVLPGIEAGVRVHAGQIIGLSGNTGNATRTPPHVHFGISHPTFAGDWQVRRGQIWPYDYLKAWTRSEDRKPKLP
jgi:peptidoglycan LD-endopeptidase LytH